MREIRQVQASFGMLLVAAGFALVLLGLAVMAGLLDWFGRLPGDIRIERGNGRVYIPITSMIIVSLVLSLAVHIISRLFR